MSLEIALTGATGFVGNAIQRNMRATKTGDIKCYALVRGNAGDCLSGAIPIGGDLHHIPAEFFPESPFVLIHFATKQIDHDNTGFEYTNVSGTRQLLDKLPDYCQGIIYGSSMSVYGQGAQCNIDEQAPVKPETDLALSRREAENLIFTYASSHNIPACVLRPRFIVGQGDGHTMPRLKKLVEQGIMANKGKPRFSIIDVDDYAYIIVSLARQMAGGSFGKLCSLNITYEESISLEDIFNTIASTCNLNHSFSSVSYDVLYAQLDKSLSDSQWLSKKTQLELICFDHYGSGAALRDRLMHDPVLGKKPIDVIRNAAAMTLDIQEKA